MQKTPIILTLAWFALVATALPHGLMRDTDGML